jgi:PIN domain nuclease of toxin-antitoxin system
MLAAQTEIEHLTLVTRDRVFDSYGIAPLRC